MLIVNLESVPNPDFRESGNLSPKQTAIVSTLGEASQECRRYIADWDLGGGNWIGGQVTDEHGNAIARISYNGRVWTPDGQPLLTA